MKPLFAAEYPKSLRADFERMLLMSYEDFPLTISGNVNFPVRRFNALMESFDRGLLVAFWETALLIDDKSPKKLLSKQGEYVNLATQKPTKIKLEFDITLQDIERVSSRAEGKLSPEQILLGVISNKVVTELGVEGSDLKKYVKRIQESGPTKRSLEEVIESLEAFKKSFLGSEKLRTFRGLCLSVGQSLSAAWAQLDDFEATLQQQGAERIPLLSFKSHNARGMAGDSDFMPGDLRPVFGFEG